MALRGDFRSPFLPQTHSAPFWQPNDFAWHEHGPHSPKDPLAGWDNPALKKKTKLTLSDFLIQAVYPYPLVISPFYIMLMISLANQKNSPDTKTVFKTEYDYIVVGAGGAGSVVASRLSEVNCVAVLLLEAGKAPEQVTEIPTLSATLVGGPLDWKFRTVPQKHTGYAIRNNELPMPRGKAIGGSSILNAMLYIRGNRKDYDEWEAQGARGWGWRDVYPYFLKAENNTDWDIVRNGYHSTHGPMTVGRFPTGSVFKDVSPKLAHYFGFQFHDINGRSQIGFADFQGNVRRGQRCSSAKAYLVPAEDRKNLDIVAEAYVTKILIEKRKAVGVQFDHKGTRYEIWAKREVILSAGCLNTPKLLMLSGIGPRRILKHFGIPVVADLPVGENFHGHPATILNFSVRRDITPFYKQNLSPFFNLVNQLRYIISRSGSIGNAQGVFSVSFFPYNYTDDPLAVPDMELYLLESIPSIALIRYQLKLSTFLRLYGPYLGKPTVSCLAEVLRPKSRGYVSIRSRNPYDPPVLDPNFLADPEDKKVIVKAMKICLKMAGSPPMQEFLTKPFRTLMPGCEKYLFNETEYLSCYARHYIISQSHEVGAVRMGDPFDSRAVVDTELRVKTITGLRVVDASVMPMVPSGNIWNPVIMVAEKASDMIKKTIHCY